MATLNLILGLISKGITSDIACMGQDSNEKVTSCESDSGSPVIRKIDGTARGKPYFQQEYVVSTGLDCSPKSTIYARVSNHEILSWIQEVTNTEPLVAVIGGYTTQKYFTFGFIPKEPGPDNRIEIISENRKCQKAIKRASAGRKSCDWECQGKENSVALDFIWGAIHKLRLHFSLFFGNTVLNTLNPCLLKLHFFCFISNVYKQRFFQVV